MLIFALNGIFVLLGSGTAAADSGCTAAAAFWRGLCSLLVTAQLHCNQPQPGSSETQILHKSRQRWTCLRGEGVCGWLVWYRAGEVYPSSDAEQYRGSGEAEVRSLPCTDQ